MTRTLWFTTTIGASDWSVYLADPEDPGLAAEHPNENANEGSALPAECVVLINRSLPRKRWLEVVVHELAHAAFHMSGTRHSLRLSEHREEPIILGIAPMLTQSLAAAGMLKLPRKSKGTA